MAWGNRFKAEVLEAIAPHPLRDIFVFYLVDATMVFTGIDGDE